MSRLTIVLALSVMLAACGFQLRGTANLPQEMSTTHVQVGDDTTLFIRELKLLLQANQVRVVEAPEPDAATLVIARQQLNRRPLTIAGDARVREFELIFNLEFRLLDKAGEELIGPESVRLVRDFRFDEQEILAATREEELLREELRRNMAAQLIRRLEAAGR